MADKPSYLGLLNAIALGEGNAHKYLRAWAEKTPRPDVRNVIQTVAIREGEHALAFEKRLCELGFSLRPKEDPNFAKTMEIASSDRSDLEKFEALGLGNSQDDAPDIFTRMFEDTTIDVQTGELLGRYIAEERDSGRLLRACYQALKDGAEDDDDEDEATSELAELRERVDDFAETLHEIAKDVKKLRKKMK